LDARCNRKANIIPNLFITKIWILLTNLDFAWILLMGPKKTITPPFQSGTKRILHSREKGWSKTRTDLRASQRLETEDRISQHNQISRANMSDLGDQKINTELERELLKQGF